MIEYYGGDIPCSCFRHRDGECQLAIPVGDNDDELVLVARLWKWSNKSMEISSSRPVGGNRFVFC